MKSRFIRKLLAAACVGPIAGLSVCAGAILFGCGGSTDLGAPPAADGASERATDAAADSSVDVSTDATTDTPTDGVVDGTTDGDASTESAPDSAPDDADAADGSTCGGPVWNGTDVGFTYSIAGGYVARPPADAACQEFAITYDFDAVANTLVQHGCPSSGPVHLTIGLTAAEKAQIVAALQAFQTVCRKAGCGADAPDEKLTVRAPAPAPPTTFTSDFYSGCPGNLAQPPFIAFDALGPFEALLSGIVNAACAGNPDAGTCVHSPADGG